MERLTKISKKVGFVLAVVAAAIIGGASTALVRAVIPSANDGQIHACYRNNSNLLDPAGALRVIDSDANQNCTTQETTLNWSSVGSDDIKTAFTKINYDQATQTWSMDASKTKNISNFQVITGDDGYPAICLKADLNPKNLVVTGASITYSGVNGIKDEADWTSADHSCDQVNGANIFFAALGSDAFVLIHGL
jgi:hypothetical protein